MATEVKSCDLKKKKHTYIYMYGNSDKHKICLEMFINLNLESKPVNIVIDVLEDRKKKNQNIEVHEVSCTYENIEISKRKLCEIFSFLGKNGRWKEHLSCVRN